MKRKDQCSLEDLYQSILNENVDDLGLTKEKIIHDINNNLMAFTFLNDDEEKNMIMEALIEILKNIYRSKESETKLIISEVINKLNQIK